MSEVIRILRERQGAETQVLFAARLGVTQGELSRFLRGERGLSRKFAAGIARAYPDLAERVIAELLTHGAPNEQASTPDAADEPAIRGTESTGLVGAALSAD